MKAKTMTLCGPIPCGANRATVMALAREIQTRLGLDPFGDEPEMALARALGTVHHEGRARLLGGWVGLVSPGGGVVPDFHPTRSGMVSHAVERRDLAHLVAHHLLHAGPVRRAHGEDAILVVGDAFEGERVDGRDLAAIEATWFCAALTLPRERVEHEIARHGFEGALRRCRMPASTFETSAKIHGLAATAA